jgi:TRAP-type C4-dicarboxylate transport system substrate-binding protein
MNALLAALLALPGPAPQDVIEVKLGTLAPKRSAWSNLLLDLREEWKQISGGKVVLKVQDGGIQGDEPVMVQKMRLGNLHASAMTGVGLSEIAPEVFALQMPMLLQSYEELDYVMERLSPRLETILREKERGVVVLHWADAGWVTFYSTKPVAALADLRKVKLGVWSSSTIEADVWKKEGVQVVPVAATDIVSSLLSGLIDACSTTPLAALSMDFPRLAPNMTELRWAPLIGATVIDKRTWGRVPESMRPKLLEAARKIGGRFRSETRKLGDDAVRLMKERKMQVHAVPEAAKAEWERTVRKYYPDIMGKNIPASLVLEIEKLRDEHRASLKKGK